MPDWMARSLRLPNPSTSCAGLTAPASAGAAFGAPLAGRLIDLGGATAGYLFAPAAGLLAVLILLLGRRALG